MEANDDIDTEALDLSFGPRYCNKCGYEVEDGYQLDGHLWSEHKDVDDEKLLACPHCDQTFKILKELMVHKKIMHVKHVSICWHFLDDSCSYDKTCWFRHEKTIVLDPICNICKNKFKTRNDRMMHKKKEHENNVKMCELIKNGDCTEKCWFSHRIKKESKEK